MDDKTRSFIALTLSPEIHGMLDTFSGKYRSSYPVGFRWVKSENIHLTMKFLGDATSVQLIEISQILDRISSKTSPFMLEINSLGSFPNWNHPRTIWIGTKSSRELDTLYRALDEETVRIGFPSEGKHFSPHLTLCRVSDHADKSTIGKFSKELQNSPEPHFGSTLIDQVVLFKSQLQPGGSIYTPVSKHPFRRQE